MESAILYIRRDDCIVGYPCVLNQIEESRIYAERNGIEIKKAFIDTDLFAQTSIKSAIQFCVENKIKVIIMHNYKSLSHKSIDRVLISKLLHKNNINIIFAQQD